MDMLRNIGQVIGPAFGSCKQGIEKEYEGFEYGPNRNQLGNTIGRWIVRLAQVLLFCGSIVGILGAFISACSFQTNAEDVIKDGFMTSITKFMTVGIICSSILGLGTSLALHNNSWRQKVYVTIVVFAVILFFTFIVPIAKNYDGRFGDESLVAHMADNGFLDEPMIATAVGGISMLLFSFLRTPKDRTDEIREEKMKGKVEDFKEMLKRQHKKNMENMQKSGITQTNYKYATADGSGYEITLSDDEIREIIRAHGNNVPSKYEVKYEVKSQSPKRFNYDVDPKKSKAFARSKNNGKMSLNEQNNGKSIELASIKPTKPEKGLPQTGEYATPPTCASPPTGEPCPTPPTCASPPTGEQKKVDEVDRRRLANHVLQRILDSINA